MPPENSILTTPPPAEGADRPLAAVDLFSGAGGFSLGLRRAGFSVVLANEFSVDPEWTYRHNLLPGELSLPVASEKAKGYAIRKHRLQVRDAILKHRKDAAKSFADTMRGGDIREALSDEWLRAWISGRRGAEVDVLVAGPPCQGFSSAGKQDEADVRNQLVFEAVRVIKVVRPKIVVIENVPGMLTRHDTILRDVGKQLSDAQPGYFLTVELLHAQAMGVPQTRKRLVLIGVRRDLMDADGHARLRHRAFPVACPAQAVDGGAVPDGEDITALDALGDLAPEPPQYDSTFEAQNYREDPGESTFRTEMRTARSAYLEGCVGGDDLGTAYWNHESSVHNATVQTRMRMLREVAAGTKESREQRCSSRWLRKHFIEAHPHLDTKKAAQRVLLPDCWPALTVTSLPDDIVHFEEDRIPTVREVARLQTFPDWFEFKGVRTTGFERRRAGVYVPQYTQVANAVPPRLAHAVAARVRHLLEELAKDKTCSWPAGEGLTGHYNLDINPPGSSARELLDDLNAAFLKMATASSVVSADSPVVSSEKPRRARRSQGARVADGGACAAVG